MIKRTVSRRSFGMMSSGLIAATALQGRAIPPAFAAETVRDGLQIGAMGALRSSLPDAAKKYDLAYDVKNFRDSTAVLLALEQGELEVGNTTTQHLIRAISEGIPVSWVCGWAGGYNVLLMRKGLNVPAGDGAALSRLASDRKKSGRPLSFGVPTGSLQHAKLSVYLKSIGIDPEKDVQVANIPFPNHPRALEAAEVDMIMTLSAFGAIAINKGDGVLYLHLFGKNYGKQEVGFVVSQKLIQQKPDLVQRIVSSHVDAIKSFMDNPDKQIELETQYSQLPAPVIAMQERQFLKYNFRTNIEDIRTMARELHQLGWVKEDFGKKVDSYVDLSFVAKATGLSTADLSAW